MFVSGGRGRSRREGRTKGEEREVSRGAAKGGKGIGLLLWRRGEGGNEILRGRGRGRKKKFRGGRSEG